MWKKFLVCTFVCIWGHLHTAHAETSVQSLVETLETSEDLQHPCARQCREGDKRICRYNFMVEWYTTMSRACFDCPFNLTDCARPHCVAADGFERPILVVNRRLPGPAIHVCLGDEVIVDVDNQLMSDTTSIHWHGIHQQGTQYMDGVPFLTQCPIAPGSTFRYHFLAENSGTHYWHSHSGLQRMDGMFGAFIVREPPEYDPLKDHYDIDDFNHIFIINDWMEKVAIDKFVALHHRTQPTRPYNILVNGRGKYRARKREHTQVYVPLSEIVIKPTYRHRLRAISNGMENCPIVISVDNHTLVIIAADGVPIQPIEVDSFTIYGGERWDFVVNASEEVGTYWIKFQGFIACNNSLHSVYQVAVLRYEGAEGFPSSLEEMTYKSITREGFNLNKVNEAPGDGTFATAAEIRALDQDDDFARMPDYKFWLHYDYKAKDNYLFHNEKHYSFASVSPKHQLYILQINDITSKYPNAPPLSQPEDVDYSSFCNGTFKKCLKEFCHCPHVLSVEKDRLVEVILVDEGFIYWSNHPFHLHGHNFKVIGMARIGENVTVETLKQMDEAGLLKRNLDHPPTKDTVTVPDGGYTIIRFITSNPGYWLFHCHLAFHAETGMGLVFRVGEPSMIPPVPKGFPRCGSWQPEPGPEFRKNALKNLDKSKVSVGFNFIPSQNSNSTSQSQNSNVDKYSSGQKSLILSFHILFLSVAMVNILI